MASNKIIFNPNTGKYEFRFGGQLLEGGGAITNPLITNSNQFLESQGVNPNIAAQPIAATQPDASLGNENAFSGGNVAGLGNMAGQFLESTGSPAGNIGGGALKGLAAGSAFGPVGMGIGAIAGGVGGLFKNKEQEEAEQAEADRINRQKMQGDLTASHAANKVYKDGGELNSGSEITEYNGGNRHEQGGVQLGNVAEVEQGETRGVGSTKDYIFSDTLIPKNGKKTFSTISKDIEKKYEGMGSDRYALEAKDKELAILQTEQENFKAEQKAEQIKRLQETSPELFADLVESGQLEVPQASEVPPTQVNPNTASGGGFAKQENTMDATYTSKQVKYGGNLRKLQLGGDLLNKGATHTMPDGTIMAGATHGGGNPVDPPTDDKKYLKQAAYDKEVAKRRAAQDDAFAKVLLSNPDAANDPELQQILRQDFDINNPFDISDIALEDSQVRTVEGNEGGFEGSGFDYKGKNWVPSSASISKYRQLMQEGKEEEAQDVVLGHFQKGKGGGQYRSSTHGEAESLGNVKPIRVADVGEAAQYIPKVDKVFEGISNFRTGGKLRYSNGGDLPKDDKGKVEGIKNYNPEQLTRHRGLMRDLHKKFPDAKIQDYAQYSFGAERNRDFFGSGEGRVNLSNTADPNLRWNPESGDPTIGHLRPTLPTTADATNAPNLPITASEFAANPDYYKGIFGPEDFEHMSNYILGDASKTQFSDSKRGIERQEVLDMVQGELTGEKVTLQDGGNPFEKLEQQRQAQGTSINAQGKAYNPLNYTRRTELSNLPQDGSLQLGVTRQNLYDARQSNLPTSFGTFPTEPGVEYTPEKFGQRLQELGFDDKTSSYLTDEGRLGGYYDWLRENAPDEFYKERNADKNQATGIGYGEHRMGVNHYRTLDAQAMRKYLGATEDIDPIQGYGPPNFDVESEIDLNQLQQSGYTPPDGTNGTPPGGGGGLGDAGGFRPDWVQAGLSALPAIGSGIASGILAKNLNYEGAQAEVAEADYVDPTRAIQEIRNQYAGVKDVARQVSSGSGNLMSNLVGATAGQAEATASVASKYDNINAGISNQFSQFNAQQKQRINQLNAQIGMQEEQDKIGLKQNAISNIAQGAATGIDTFYKSRRDATHLNLAGGENYSVKSVGPSWNQKAVKVFNGYGYQYYDDPDTGSRVYLNEKGNKIRSKEKIAGIQNDISKKVKSKSKQD